jgi:hypothetical protein
LEWWREPPPSAVLRSVVSFVSFKSGNVAPASRQAIALRLPQSSIDAIGWKNPLDPSSKRAALTNGCDEVCDIQGPRGPKMSDSSPLSPTLVPTRRPGHKAAFEIFRDYGPGHKTWG